MVRRIARNPTPTDLAQKIIMEAAAKLQGLREIADTDEFRAVANACESASPGSGTPTFEIGYDKKWSFQVYLSDLQAWEDDKKLMTVLRALEAVDPDETQVKDFPDSNNRDHYYKWKYEGEFTIDVRVYAYLSKTAPGACRRIQVGTKMVETPIYRNECAAPEAEAGDAKLPPPILQIEAL